VAGAAECDITAAWVRARRGVAVLINPVSVAVELEESDSFLSFNLTHLHPLLALIKKKESSKRRMDHRSV
jgi:hypothetical protein